MGVDIEENFPPFQRHIEIVEVEMDGAAIYRRDAETRLLPLLIGPSLAGVAYPICLKPYTGRDLPSGTIQQ